ncbi:hypothetical protein [Raineyella sp. LH-20]|uniref:hypothetical protein n=1 Tax=Raineyella sp. LH-20 TaxID=3081204 RepID=UPI0029541785|nr:hypothetical protein [Raineyella sp. LH-20]WOP19134.1 hypothetical protein R0146_02355 [Raineyella sp. LH-20]
MTTAVKYLARLIALLVVVQAAVVVWGVAEEIRFQEANPGAQVPFPVGAMLHGTIGMYVIPAVALILFILTLIARRARLWAGLALVSAVLQVAVGLGGILLSPYLGLIHGVNAFVLAGLAMMTARAIDPSQATTAPARRPTQAVG